MARYIDLSNPKIIHTDRDKFGNGIYHIPPDLPTADVVEVKHGKWKLNKDGNWACPFCEFDPYHDSMKGMNYCPNCGADLRKEKNNA